MNDEIEQIEKNIKTGMYNSSSKSVADAIEYHLQRIKARKKFQNDLERLFNLTKHPKKDKLFEIAWDMGHAFGFMEVAQYYECLSELLM